MMLCMASNGAPISTSFWAGKETRNQLWANEKKNYVQRASYVGMKVVGGKDVSQYGWKQGARSVGI